METKSDRYYLRAVVLWIGAWTVFRAVYSAGFLLAPDEANYWQWGRHLAWGYHDQAPLLGWAIGLFTRLLGNSEFAVRLPSVLSMAGASAYMCAMAWRWFSPRAAWAVALLSQGVLAFNAGGLLATCDGLQALGWAAAAYHGARACEDGSWRHWMACGLWFGFGMLAKYTMVVIAPCILAFGLAHPDFRKRLKSPRPYVAFVAGMALFSPVIWWNMAHGWQSVRHVAYIGGANQEFSLHVKYLGDLLGSQAALLTPLVFILVAAAWAAAVRGRYQPKHWIVPFALATSLPVLLLFVALSLHTRVYGNWPGAAYITATVLAAAFYAPVGPGPGSTLPRPRPKLWKWALGTSYGLTALLLAQTAFFVFPIPVDIDRTAYELGGWDELGEAAHAMQKAMPRPEETFLFGVRYQVASELAFYAPGNPHTVSINRWNRPNVYDYWWEDGQLRGKDAVGAVTRHPQVYKKRLAEVFEKVEGPIEVPITRTRPLTGNKVQIRTFYLFACYNFQGGIHWRPPAGFDVRKT
ncbi:MAG: glycosyltransferase family 39 protein [Deltaproteobacteria bacterium]|nr:glycosyltransferase family 39 protein [Deltaproteobacteria bacterium]